MRRRFFLLAAIGAQARLSAAYAADRPEPRWLQRLRELARNPGSDPETRWRVETGPAELSRQYGIAQKEGLSLTPEVWEGEPLRPTENAAYGYWELEKVLRRQPLQPEEQSHRQDLGNPLRRTPETVRRVRQLFAERADVAHLLDRITTTARCAYTEDATERGQMIPSGGRRPLLRAATFREAARLTVTRSLLQALAGAPEEAIALLQRGFQISSHAVSQPGLVGCFIGETCDAILRRGLEQVLLLSEPSPALLACAQAALPHRDYWAWGQQGLMGELAQHLHHTERFAQLERVPTLVADSPFDYLDQLREGGPRIEYVPLAPLNGEESRLWARFWPAVAAELLGVFRPLILDTSRNYLQTKRRYREAEARLSAYPDCPVRAAAFWMFAGSIAPDWPARAEAREGVFRAALAVLRYRAEHGAYPQHLEQALSPVPRDPVVDQPLQYRLTGEGFVVFTSRSTDRGKRPNASEDQFSYPRGVAR